MCSRVTCSQCRKPTWRGCGAHVEAVLGDVPPDQRCQCQRGARAGAGQGISASAWLRGLLSRKPGEGG